MMRNLPNSEGDAEIEDAQFEVVESTTTANLGARVPQMPRLDYMPGLRQGGQGRIDVVAQRDEDGAGSWGIWGAVLAVAALAGFITFGGTSFFEIRDILIAVLLAGVAVALFRWGPRGGQHDVKLVTLDTERGEILWPTQGRGGGQISVSMENVSEVVFAMIRAPVSVTKPDAHIQVYSLLIRQGDGADLITVIEASPDQQRVFAIAQQFAALMQVPLTQIGEGVREP